MTRTFVSFNVTDTKAFKDKMLSWVNRFNIFCFLDNHHYQLPYNTHECLLAAGCVTKFNYGDDFFGSLSSFYNDTDDWIFGHFNYDLKNKIENLTSQLPDNIGFPDAFLFVPELLIQLTNNAVSIGLSGDFHADIFKQIIETIPDEPINGKPIAIKAKIEKDNYFKIIEQLRNHIKRGDCYEINFCQEFFAQSADVNPLIVYQKLVAISPNPFAAYYKIDDKYLLCSSPERYMKKTGSTIISQPIKGTSQRDLLDVKNDESYKDDLINSPKERSENIMIVDLVRNDLSKICKEGSVDVESLFEPYTFPYVHQMISTVRGVLEDGIDLSDILLATFPMGSMTGAPKKRVLELIEQFEKTKRGIYSGTVGYITPEKDFDFNVVIRSIMYNATDKYLSYQVGGGITYNSIPDNEYEECLVKAAAIKKVL